VGGQNQRKKVEVKGSQSGSDVKEGLKDSVPGERLVSNPRELKGLEGHVSASESSGREGLQSKMEKLICQKGKGKAKASTGKSQKRRWGTWPEKEIHFGIEKKGVLAIDWSKERN